MYRNDNKKDKEAVGNIQAELLGLNEQSDVTPWTPLSPDWELPVYLTKNHRATKNYCSEEQVPAEENDHIMIKNQEQNARCTLAPTEGLHIEVWVVGFQVDFKSNCVLPGEDRERASAGGMHWRRK